MNRKYLPLFVLATLAVPFAALAQEVRLTPRIVVIGEGQVAVVPDMAVISLSVMREAETARQALSANNDAMAAVIAAMKEAGIDNRDIRTEGLQINPRYVYPKDDDIDRQPEIVAYQVSNTLSVRVRNIDDVGKIIDRSVTLGVNQGGEIVFTSDDPAQAMTEARKRAVEDAIARAKTITDAAGLNLGRIIEISERDTASGPITGRAYRMADTVESVVPVAAGENTYRAQVNMTFELEQ